MIQRFFKKEGTTELLFALLLWVLAYLAWGTDPVRAQIYEMAGWVMLVTSVILQSMERTLNKILDYMEELNERQT